MERKQSEIKYRYERKFLVPLYLDSHALFLIQNSSIGFQQSNPARRVNSIYFDSDDLLFAKQNIDGVSQRYKVRVRYYGLLNSLNNPLLEIKYKQGNVGSKYLIKLKKPFSFGDEINLISLFELNELPNDLIDLFHSLIPKVFVSYYRNYYLSYCNNYRLTYDHSIVYKSMETNVISKFSEDSFIHSNNNILELKYDIEHDNYSSKTIDKLPFRLSRNSKYVNALYMTGLII